MAVSVAHLPPPTAQPAPLSAQHLPLASVMSPVNQVTVLQLTPAEERVRVLESTVTEMHEEFTETRRQLAQLFHDRDTLRGQLTKEERLRSELQNTLAASQRQVEELRGQIQELGQLQDIQRQLQVRQDHRQETQEQRTQRNELDIGRCLAREGTLRDYITQKEGELAIKQGRQTFGGSYIT